MFLAFCNLLVKRHDKHHNLKINPIGDAATGGRIRRKDAGLGSNSVEHQPKRVWGLARERHHEVSGRLTPQVWRRIGTFMAGTCS